jgi:hypothetical protein
MKRPGGCPTASGSRNLRHGTRGGRTSTWHHHTRGRVCSQEAWAKFCRVEQKDTKRYKKIPYRIFKNDEYWQSGRVGTCFTGGFLRVHAARRPQSGATPDWTRRRRVLHKGFPCLSAFFAPLRSSRPCVKKSAWIGVARPPFGNSAFIIAPVTLEIECWALNVECFLCPFPILAFFPPLR